MTPTRLSLPLRKRSRISASPRNGPGRARLSRAQCLLAIWSRRSPASSRPRAASASSIHPLRRAEIPRRIELGEIVGGDANLAVGFDELQPVLHGRDEMKRIAEPAIGL